MLGISIYPQKEKEYETLNYIDLAAKYGFRKVVINLSNLEEIQADVLSKVKNATERARKYRMDVTLNVKTALFQNLVKKFDNLKFIKNMGVTGIRVESISDDLVETIITNDASGLELELDISNDTHFVEKLLSYEVNQNRIMGCHKYLSEDYTGIDYDYFMKATKKFKDLGLRTAAFVSSDEAENSPYKSAYGLCTLEMHRDMDIDTQAKHLFATGLIDDVIISNSFASEEELEALSDLKPDELQFTVWFERKSTKLERDIVLNHEHYSRGDIDCYSIRSTYMNLDYNEREIENNMSFPELVAGEITVRNRISDKFNGELSIEKFDRPNLLKSKNVVATIVKRERFLMQYIKPGAKFSFQEGVEAESYWD